MAASVVTVNVSVFLVVPADVTGEFVTENTGEFVFAADVEGDMEEIAEVESLVEPRNPEVVGLSVDGLVPS